MNQALSAPSEVTGETNTNQRPQTLQDFRNALARLDITREAHKFLWDYRDAILAAFNRMAKSAPCDAIRLLVTLDDENSVQMTPSFWGMFLPHIEQALSRSRNQEERALAYRDVLLVAPDVESQNSFLIRHAEDLSVFLLEDIELSGHFNLRNLLVSCDSAEVLEAYSPYLQEYFDSQDPDNLDTPRTRKEHDNHIIFVMRLLRAYDRLEIEPPDYLIDARMKELESLVTRAFKIASKQIHSGAHITNVLLSATCLGIQSGDPICTIEMETPTANVKLFHLDTTHIPDTTGSLYVLCQSYEESGDIRPLLIGKTRDSLVAAANAVFDLPVTAEDIRRMTEESTLRPPSPY